MLSLTNLPNELLVKIISDSRPAGFEGLILSCKHFYDLATSFNLLAPYNDLKKRWSVWEAQPTNYTRRGYPEQKYPKDRHPLTMLAAIHENPIVAEYIQIVRLPDNLRDAIRGFGAKFYRSQWEVYEDSALPIERLAEIVLSSIIPDTSVEFTAWGEWVYEDNGCHDRDVRPLILMILTMLPYVTRMSLSCEWPYEEEAEGPMEPEILSLLHAFHKPNSCRGLSRLVEIEPWRVTSPAGCSLSGLLHVLPIPSLRKVSAVHLRADTSSHLYRRHCESDCPSNVEQIELTSSYIETYRLEFFLKPCRHLRIFKYEHGVFQDGAGKHWDARSFVEMLCESPAAETLEELSLTISGANIKVTAPQSFKDLKRLRSLELHIDFLYPQKSSRFYSMSSERKSASATTTPHNDASQGAERLFEIVPSSLSELSIVFAPLRGWQPELFQDLALHRREKLPVLNRLQVTTSHTICLEVNPETMKRDIEIVGVDYELDVTMWGFAKHTRHITHDLDLRTLWWL